MRWLLIQLCVLLFTTYAHIRHLGMIAPSTNRNSFWHLLSWLSIKAATATEAYGCLNKAHHTTIAFSYITLQLKTALRQKC